jgi:cold shock CspA family protein
MTGRVYRVVRDKGFAFLRDEDGCSRFIMAKNFVDPTQFDHLSEGATVEFEPVSEGGGDPKAKGNKLRGNEVRICSY